MLLSIDDNKTVGDIQEKFAECFPDLKIAFFKSAHSWNKNLSTQEAVGASQKIGEIRKTHEPAIIEIRSQYKVGKVEREFKKKLKLFTRIYYKVNGKLLPAIHNDKVSLAQLSDLSRAPIAFQK